MGLKLNGATSGSIEIDVPAVAGTDTAITIPATTGGEFIVSDSSGNIDLGPLDINGGASDDSVNIDGSGRLLVGTTSAVTTSMGFIQQGSAGAASSAANILLAKNTTSVSDGSSLGTIYFSDSSQDLAAYIDCARDGGTWTSGSSQPTRLAFSVTKNGVSGPTERMRILKSGEILSYSDTYCYAIKTNATAGTTYSLISGWHSATSTVSSATNSFRVWSNGNVQNTNDSYGQLSDIKLKENIVDAESQWDDFKAVRFRKYNFKEETGYETHTQLGVIAQELELVSPGLVYETPDLDEEGNDLGTTTKAVKSSILVKKAMVALQEAMERIETLEAANASQAATIAALDARLTALEGGAS